MPSPPRILLPKTVVFITSRTEAGLPLVAGPLMNAILKSIIARALSLYSVKLCHFLFMGNHFHMILVVEDPVEMMHFIERVKTESAHAINRLLGHRRRTVWCSGYDAQPILTLDDVIEKIAYLYTNPQKAGLVESIDEFPGLSSWNHSLADPVPWIPRSAIEPLERLSLSEGQQDALVRSLTADSSQCFPLTLRPDAWISLFLGAPAPLEIRERIVSRVRDLEREHATQRAQSNKSILGRRRLIIQPFNQSFSPVKFARRMWCICSDRVRRIGFIEYLKKLRSEARAVYRRWRQGDRTIQYPPGMFPPRFPILASLIGPIRV